MSVCDDSSLRDSVAGRFVASASESCGLGSELFDPTSVTVLKLLGDDGALMTVLSENEFTFYLSHVQNNEIIWLFQNN